MKLVRLIYTSVMTPQCDREELENILKVARENNSKNYITGLLCYDPEFFLQCIEGPRDAINKLYNHINRDNRHKNATLLEYAEVKERVFGNWSMGFMPSSLLDKSILEKYAPNGGALDPFSWSGEQALSFLIEVCTLNVSLRDKSNK